MVMWCHVICPYFLCLVSSWRGPEILPGICTDALPIFQPTASGMQRLLFPWNTTATRVYNSPMEQYSTAIRSVRSYMSDKIFRPPWSNAMTLLVFTIDFMCKREVSININSRWFHNPTSTFQERRETCKFQNITCATQPPCFKIQVWDFHNRPVSTYNTTEYNRHFKGQQKSFSKYFQIQLTCCASQLDAWWVMVRGLALFFWFFRSHLGDPNLNQGSPEQNCALCALRGADPMVSGEPWYKHPVLYTKLGMYKWGGFDWLMEVCVLNFLEVCWNSSSTSRF